MSFLISLLMMAGLANAAGPATCPDIFEKHDGTKIQQIWSDASESCFFSVVPDDAYVELVYRDHLFTSEGLFMVFNSYGPGDESQTTAAREFYMFPRRNSTFTYQWKDDTRELEVTHVTGDKFVFDSKKARLKSVSGGTVTVADYVEPSNRGGIEFVKYNGLILDGGFKLGSSPTGNSNGNSVFRDAQDKKCSIKNYEVFKYTSDGEIIFKYDDKALATFLKKRCSQLQFP